MEDEGVGLKYLIGCELASTVLQSQIGSGSVVITNNKIHFSAVYYSVTMSLIGKNRICVSPFLP